MSNIARISVNMPVFQPWMEHHKYADAWCEFHLNNPHIYILIVVALHQAMLEGRKSSTKEIINKIRFDQTIKINRTGDTYSINDAFTSVYGMVIYENVPSLRSTFESELWHRMRSKFYHPQNKF